MSETSEIQDVSLYEKIGGEAAVNAAVDLFYEKVLNDYTISRFFDKTDMAKQVEHLKAFMTVAFGGPNNYTGRSLRDGHARLVKMGLNDAHYDAVLGAFWSDLARVAGPGRTYNAGCRHCGKR